MKRLAPFLLVGMLPAFAESVPGPPDEWAQRVLSAVQSARRAAGLDELIYRADLEAISSDGVRRLAAVPHSSRLTEPVEGDLRRSGIRYRRSSVHVDLNKGYDDPAARFIEDWRTYEQAWVKVMSPQFDAIGLSTGRSSDGWVILVGILLEQEILPSVPDLRAMEIETLREANRARVERGLPPLTANPDLTVIARAHSEDMIRRRFFDHRTPDGLDAMDRVRARGLSVRRVSENMHRSRGVEDPGRTAVQSWLQSEGHRRNLLDEEFREMGIGIAMDDDGTLYFTQLFLTRLE